MHFNEDEDRAKGSPLTFGDGETTLPHDIAQTRIVSIRTHLLQAININNQGAIARTNERMQSRMFFVAILAGLFAISLTPSGEQTHSNIFRSASAAYTASAIMIFMYLLDVHLANIDRRYKGDYERLVNGLVQLDSLDRNNDDRWCAMDAPSQTEKLTGAQRLEQKLCEATKPNLEQVLCYFVPLSLILLLTAVRIRRALTSGWS